VDVQTGETTTIVLGKGAPPFFSVSTDGRDLLYVDARGIVARDLTTGEERIAVARDTRSFVGWIGISPDGRSIAFVGWSEERGQQVRALEVQTLGGISRELVRVQAPNDLRFHSWTPDGQHLLYTTLARGRAGYSLRSVAVDGGEPQDMRFSLGQIVNPISLSPDGRTIAYPDRILWSDLWIRERFWPAALTARQR
jgi:Tol biopolymer transport system component